MKALKKITAIIMVVSILCCSFALGASAAGSKKNYLLLGDSIAYGAGIINSTEACYGKIVANTNGYNYTNDAISGSTSAALLALLSDSLVAADVKKADIIQISIGGNDYLTNNWIGMGLLGRITGSYSHFDTIAESFAENFGKIIKKIRSLNSGATIIVQTLYNPNNGSWNDTYQEGVNRLNNVYYSYLKDHPGSYIIADVGSVITGHSEYVAMDTIHPNAKGNVAIAKYMLSFLKARGLGSSTTPVIEYEPIDNTGFGIRYSISIVMFALRFMTRFVDIF